MPEILSLVFTRATLVLSGFGVGQQLRDGSQTSQREMTLILDRLTKAIIGTMEAIKDTQRTKVGIESEKIIV